MSNIPQLTLSPTLNSKMNLMPPTTIVGQNGGLKLPQQTGGSATGEFFSI